MIFAIITRCSWCSTILSADHEANCWNFFISAPHAAEHFQQLSEGTAYLSGNSDAVSHVRCILFAINETELRFEPVKGLGTFPLSWKAPPALYVTVSTRDLMSFVNFFLSVERFCPPYCEHTFHQRSEAKCKCLQWMEVKAIYSCQTTLYYFHSFKATGKWYYVAYLDSRAVRYTTVKIWSKSVQYIFT